MSSCKVRGSEREKIISILDSVLDSNSEDSDISDDEVSLDNCEVINGKEESDSSESDSEIDELEVRANNRRSILENCKWVWTSGENTPIIHEFSGQSGISDTIFRKYENNCPLEVSVFSDYMDPLFSIIAKESNDYAERQLRNEARRKRKDDDKWFPTTEDEIKAYIALCILMAQVRKPRVKLYWSKESCIETPIFGQTMSRERFLLLSRFLHFTDDLNYGAADDKLKKLRPILTHFSQKFSELNYLCQNISLDESLMKYRGRLPYVQCNRSKRARFGIKFYKICDSDTGYCHSFRIYTGQDVTNPSLPASTNVVIDMCDSLFNKGHTLFVDNWYTSPDLCKMVLERGTNIVGTVRPNRKNMPPSITSTKLKTGEHEIWSSNNILCLRWRDKKDVYFLSSKHERADMTATGKLKRKRGQQPREEINKPRPCLEYQNGMKGVDLQDQVTALFPIMRRTVKGYRKIFFYILDICLFNSYIVHQALVNKTAHFTDFRIAIGRQLLESINLPDYKVRGRPSSGPTPLRLQAKNWAHFPMRIPETANKKNPSKRCFVCYQNKKRSETTWQCEKCEVALHLPECFKLFHTRSSV